MATSTSTRRPTKADLTAAEARRDQALAEADELRARLKVAEFTSSATTTVADP